MLHRPTARQWIAGLIKASLFGAAVVALAVAITGRFPPSVSPAWAGSCSTDADCVTPCKATPNYIKWTSLNNQGVEPNNYTTVDISCNYEKKCIRAQWGGGMTSRASDNTNQGQIAFIQYCK